MNALHLTQTARFRRFAATIGPREAAALAGTMPFLESQELARILTSSPIPEGAPTP